MCMQELKLKQPKRGNQQIDRSELKMMICKIMLLAIYEDHTVTRRMVGVVKHPVAF